MHPIIAPLIAAATALFIAVVIYPVQKRRDRQLQVSLERRALYGALIRSATKLRFALFFLKKPRDEVEGLLVDFFCDAAAVSTYSTSEVAAAAAKLERCLSVPKDQKIFQSKFDDGWGDLLYAVRKESFEGNAEMDEYWKNDYLASIRDELRSRNQRSPEDSDEGQ